MVSIKEILFIFIFLYFNADSLVAEDEQRSGMK